MRTRPRNNKVQSAVNLFCWWRNQKMKSKRLNVCFNEFSLFSEWNRCTKRTRDIDRFVVAKQPKLSSLNVNNSFWKSIKRKRDTIASKRINHNIMCEYARVCECCNFRRAHPIIMAIKKNDWEGHNESERNWIEREQMRPDASFRHFLLRNNQFADRQTNCHRPFCQTLTSRHFEFQSRDHLFRFVWSFDRFTLVTSETLILVFRSLSSVSFS